MKFYLVDGTFKRPIDFKDEETMKHFNGHMNFLKKGVNEGWLLLTGGKPTEGGGILIVKAEDIDAASHYFDEDPLKIYDINDYRIVEFGFADGQDCVKEWFV